MTQIEEIVLALHVAESTIDGWVEGLEGYVKIHKDVIRKAVNAAMYAAQGGWRSVVFNAKPAECFLPEDELGVKHTQLICSCGIIYERDEEGAMVAKRCWACGDYAHAGPCEDRKRYYKGIANG